MRPPGCATLDKQIEVPINNLSVLNCGLILKLLTGKFVTFTCNSRCRYICSRCTVRLSMFEMLILLLNYSPVSSGVTRGLSQRGKLS